MLYLGIDQHARQITVSLRDETGDVLLARQVSTQPEKIQAFFQQLTRERLRNGDSFVAVLEVCGFNEWLIRMLQDYRCQKVILIQPDDRNKRKTDRRDAAALSELLWVNRERLLAGKPVRGLRQVNIASTSDQENRRLTTLRRTAGQDRTRLVNKVRQILRRHNLQWQMPTKRFPTLSAMAWLRTLQLPEIDRLEMDHLLADLEHVQQRLQDLENVIRERGLSSGPGGAVPPFPQPGQLLGTHTRLSEQRGEDAATGEHHQSRQQHGAVVAGAAVGQGPAERRSDAGVVQADQTPAGSEDRPCGRDAKAGHDHLAYAEQTKDVYGMSSCRCYLNRDGSSEKNHHHTQ